ncbi:MAG: flavin reductase [Bacteriovoracaceae bacterium]|nr:flavin reductase [Bacteriovoracaceae bacterium]
MSLNGLHKLSYGLYIISSKMGDIYNGQIANASIQVTSDPATIAVCINKKNYTHEFIKDSRAFTVSILAQDTPMDLIAKFGFNSGRDVAKFDGIEFKAGKTGAPTELAHCVGHIEADVISSTDVGTHTIFIAKVVDSVVYNKKEVLTYDYYHKVKKGATPKTAPSYIPSSANHVCKICNYEYNEKVGDEKAAVPSGTLFEDLPNTWVCPVCGADKSNFS